MRIPKFKKPNLHPAPFKITEDVSLMQYKPYHYALIISLVQKQSLCLYMLRSKLKQEVVYVL